MSSKIEWTDATHNPIRARREVDGVMQVGWHCEHASPGCINCYSETRNLSGRCNMGTKLPFKPGHRKDVEIFLDEKTLLQPLRWKKARMVFVCSMTDLFADFVPDEWLDRIFAVMALCPQHTFQVLTKRSDRMREYLNSDDAYSRIFDAAMDMLALCRNPDGIFCAEGPDEPASSFANWPLENVWAGVSVEDQQRADERIPDLLATPAAVRWLSCEPLLGPLYPWGHVVDEVPGIDWVVAGGESGPNARGSTAEVETWMRSLRDQCRAAGVPFFGKQNFKKHPLPDDLMVREMPHGR